MPAVMTETGGCLAEAARSHEQALAALLAGQEYHPYEPYRDLLRHGAVRDWQAARASLYLDCPEGLTLVWEGGEPVGAGFWKPLAWDTRMLGIAAGRIDVLVAAGEYRRAVERKAELLHQITAGARRAGVRHLSIRTDTGDLSSLHALTRAGFEVVDGIQTFALVLGESASGLHAPGSSEVSPFRPEDLSGVLAIARSSYRFDRFHADPALRPEAADALHEQWVENSCAGTAADAVLVARNAREVLGFVTLKWDSEMQRWGSLRLATVVLVATAERARGRGVGRALTLAAVDWARAGGARVIQVGTQLRNIPAARLYEACGFRLAATSLTLRALL